MRDDAIVEQTRRLVLEHGGDVVVAWLFGSTATGQAGPDSDVDVAILPAGERRPSTLDDLPTGLEDHLARELGRPVQIIDVRTAPADLVHRVLRDGILLIDRDPSRRIRFEVASRNRYFDMTPIWRRYRAARRTA